MWDPHTSIYTTPCDSRKCARGPRHPCLYSLIVPASGCAGAERKQERGMCRSPPPLTHHPSWHRPLEPRPGCSGERLPRDPINSTTFPSLQPCVSLSIAVASISQYRWLELCLGWNVRISLLSSFIYVYV